MRTAGHIKNVRTWDSIPYKLTYYNDFDFTHFKSIDLKYKTKSGRHSYNDVIIMADTETSKSINYPACIDNYIVAWSIAFRSFGHNLVTLYGHSPSEFTDMLKKLRENLPGKDIYIYFHNLSYDWPFLRKFMIKEFGKPVNQLNTKSLFPLFIKFENGIMFKDSLSLAQCKLEKWAEDLNVDHKKQIGKWDYDKRRNQNGYNFTSDELDYIEGDVVAGVECIDKYLETLSKNISSIPYTNTGIVRDQARKAGGMDAHYDYTKIAPGNFEEQIKDEEVFHGGYTHANRYYLGITMSGECMDICSSYPFEAMRCKAPIEAWTKVNREVDFKYILEDNPNYAFRFRIKAFDIDLQNLRYPMPVLSLAKCRQTINAIVDNGRILKCDYAEWLSNEIDIKLFLKQYKFDEKSLVITDVYTARKDYLPRWFTDFIFQRFISKTKLKGVDKVRYQIEKGMLNAGSYGMCAQKPVKPLIEEDYETGEFKEKEDMNFEKEYEDHVNNKRSFLPYVWGIYITSGAQEHLFELGDCVADDGIWLYSDTDSVYATKFDKEKLKAYNERAIQTIKDRGYEPVFWHEKYYNLGVAEFDGAFTEFRTWHSKCYVKRHADDNELEITIAGVPKKGVATLENDINNFIPGIIFDGETSGKLTHKHINVPEIYYDAAGNEIGDSVDLTPCDYVVKGVNEVDFQAFDEEEININFYE